MMRKPLPPKGLGSAGCWSVCSLRVNSHKYDTPGIGSLCDIGCEADGNCQEPRTLSLEPAAAWLHTERVASNSHELHMVMRIYIHFNIPNTVHLVDVRAQGVVLGPCLCWQGNGASQVCGGLMYELYSQVDHLCVVDRQVKGQLLLLRRCADGGSPTPWSGPAQAGPAIAVG